MSRKQLVTAFLAASLGWFVCVATAEARFLRRARTADPLTPTAAAPAPITPASEVSTVRVRITPVSQESVSPVRINPVPEEAVSHDENSCDPQWSGASGGSGSMGGHGWSTAPRRPADFGKIPPY